MKKVIVTGATGYLGKSLLPILAQQADVIGIARNVDTLNKQCNAVSVDITQKAALTDLFITEKPDAVIHCAACNPGGSSENMFAINEQGGSHVADAAKHVNCRLVAVSSDTVLSGNNAPYRDNAAAEPLPDNAYAVSKARSEAIVLSTVPDAIVVRTSLIYGTEHMDRGTEGFAARLHSGEPLNLFADVIRQPVHDVALSHALCELALNLVAEAGTINIAGDEAMSRYDFGKTMLDFWRVDYQNNLNKVSGNGIAGLPIDLRLTLDRARSLGIATPGVRSVLATA